MQLLEDLYKKQSDTVGKIDWQEESESLRNLSDLGLLAKKTMGRVSTTFKQHSESIGSWVSGDSLILQILTQPRLTVDITPNELNKERPFGMPFISLCEMAELGFVYLNFRDYDSDLKNNFIAHKQETVAKRIEELFDKAKSQLYIGSALRKPIFDTALQSSGYDCSYEKYYNEAIENLSKAEKCFQDSKSIQNEAEFRKEKTSLVAVAYHWAYLNAISYFLPSHLIKIDSHKYETNPESELNRLFKNAVELGDESISRPYTSIKEKAARAYVLLARRLRSCHLNFTAPLTASWGTTYNMTADEYIASKDVRDYWREPKFQATDIEVNRFVYYMIQEANDSVHPSFRDIGLNNMTLKEQIDDRVFKKGDISSLLKVRASRENRINEAANILSEVKQSYIRDGIFTDKQRLQKLVRDYKMIQIENFQQYLKALEGVLNDILTPAATEILGPAIFPWLVPMLSKTVEYSIGALVDRLGNIPEGHKQITRVKQLISSK